MTKYEPTKNLYMRTVDAQPIPYEWDAHEDRGSWESAQAGECSECGAYFVLSGEDERQHCDLDSESACEGYVNTSAPMMNYYYPIPSYEMDLDESALKLKGLPLCVVYFRDAEEYALALTGGGMDFSWEICEAYMRCGYLPPAHFVRDLPNMGDVTRDTGKQWVLRGALRTASVLASESVRIRQDVRRLRGGAS